MIESIKQYIYPKLPAQKDLLFFRLGGSGLANCLFIYAKAIIRAEQTGQKIITPTWLNLSTGAYTRKQRDKRHYKNIFNKDQVAIFQKLYLLILKNKNIEIIEGLDSYFVALKGNNEVIRQYLQNQFTEEVKMNLPVKQSNIISIHIRLGDYPQERRVPLIWYKEVIQTIQKYHNSKYTFHLYSDGSDKELEELFELENLKRKDYGQAILDLWAVSQSKLIIASDSTFSAWAAYLNQVPVIFQKRHFPPVLDDLNHELVVGNKIEDISEFLKSVI